MTLYPRIMTDRGSMLGAEFRYLHETGMATISGAYMPNDKLREDEPGFGSRGYFAVNGYHNLSRNWQTRANIMHISDPRYFEDFNNSIQGIAVYNAHSDVGLYGRGRNWTAGLMADNYQLADYTLTETSLPFDRVPRAYASYQWRDTIFDIGVDATAVRFQKDAAFVSRPARPGVPREFGSGGGSRLDVKPYISLPLEGASWFFKPTLAWRYTAYQVDADYAAATRVARDRRRAACRSAASTRACTSTATATIDGDRYLHTLEPRLFYLNAPVPQPGRPAGLRHRRDSPSAGASCSATTATPAPTGRRMPTSSPLALTTRLIREADGQERLSASIGQIRYFDDARSCCPAKRPIEQGKLGLGRRRELGAERPLEPRRSYQWNPKYRDEDLTSVRARYMLRRRRHGQPRRYRFRRASTRRKQDLLEQADFSFLYPINPTWSVVGRYYYSILDKQAAGDDRRRPVGQLLPRRSLGRPPLRAQSRRRTGCPASCSSSNSRASARPARTPRARPAPWLSSATTAMTCISCRPNSAERLNHGGGQVEPTPDPTL